MKKSQLPEKICVVCQRPFRWRKKWERDWPMVKYCSKRCRSSRPQSE
ncbi:DUF2256 domain-containing protein [Aliivibrio fischeri]|nr:DUF2256 domain-containing protein [Aliivibrio fischeri]MCE7553631.1 DUF2256 domain-containing protein [Aliivibrio fischeri]MCE7561517.1 DUF2256 domain-containing protein [Aliivibrio fischeri]MCE7565175.1 DUF2256 domain-containing protein [Aliivibrio fischeri]MCE7568925.1 DUF2256 domain-containing protein [Aliivibrio fischeri]